MARKAPKNPISDIVDSVGAWFGGSRGAATNPQVSRVSRDLGRAVSAADTVTGGFGAAALRDVKMIQQGGSLPTNLAKTTAVNLAAGAVGAKAAQVAGRAVAKTGVAARVANKLTGQEVLIHSSPIKNLSRIEPKISTDLTRLEPNKALTFGVRSSAKGSRNYVGQYAEEITSWRSTTATGLAGKPQSVYITKTPSKNVTPYQFQGMWGRTPSSQRVVKEIPIENKTVDQLAREIASASRRAGRPLRKEKNIVEDIRFKAAKASSRRKNKNNQMGPAID